MRGVRGDQQSISTAAREESNVFANSECQIDVISVSTQTYTHEPGSLEAFVDTCEIHKRQLRTTIAAHKTACDRSRRLFPATPLSTLLCPNCKDMFEPKVKQALALPCGHSLCRMCAQKTPRMRVLPCPIDHKNHIIPTDGFPPDYLLMELVEKAKADPEYICPEHSVPVVGFCRQDSILICGDCVFSHRTHACLDFQSANFERFAKELHSDLMRANEEMRSSQEGWVAYITMFDMCCMQLACSALATYVGYKDMVAMSSGLPVSYERQEAAFKQICAMLEDIRKQHYELLDVGRKRSADLELLCRDFKAMSSPEKVMLSATVPRERIDFELFVREFSSVLNHANCYTAQPTYMQMQPTPFI